MADAAGITPGFKQNVQQMGGHVADAGRSALDAAKTGLGKANELARTGVEKSITSIKADGFWKSVANGARHQPLLAGAAGVTAVWGASHAFASPRRQTIHMQREQGQSQGRGF